MNFIRLAGLILALSSLALPPTSPDPEEAGFLRSIYAEPGNDTPRLAYADWLDEKKRPGDAEQAKLIRIEIRRHNFGTPRLWEDRKKENDELYAARSVVEQRLPKFVRDLRDSGAIRLEFRRGFPEVLALDTSSAPRNLRPLFEALPYVTTVQLTGTKAETREWRALVNGLQKLPEEELSRVRNLRFVGVPLDEKSFKDVVSAMPNLTELELLDVPRFARLTDTLIALPQASRLTSLEMGGSILNDADFRKMPRAFNALRRFHIVTDSGISSIEPLSREGAFPNLVDLRLEVPSRPGEVEWFISHSPLFGQLELLRLMPRGDLTPDQLTVARHDLTLPNLVRDRANHRLRELELWGVLVSEPKSLRDQFFKNAEAQGCMEVVSRLIYANSGS